MKRASCQSWSGTTWRSWMLPVVSLVALAGCDGQEYSHIRFEAVTSPPLQASVTSDKITIPAGIALQVLATPVADGVSYDSHDRLSLVSDDDSVLRVFGTASRNQFVLSGFDEGSTCLEVRINGSREDCIRVSITAQK